MTVETATALPPLSRAVPADIAKALATSKVLAPTRKSKLLWNVDDGEDSWRQESQAPVVHSTLFRRRLTPEGSSKACLLRPDTTTPIPGAKGEACEKAAAGIASRKRESKPQVKLLNRQNAQRLRVLKQAYLGSAGQCDEESIEDYPGISAILNTAAPETDDEREQRLKRELASVRTGEDAIKFFTRHGGDSSVGVKLLYCNRAGLEDTYPSSGRGPGPYDLVVVVPQDVNAEYFTISISGVIHFRPGELSECTPLSGWMQQVFLYRCLTSINFFRVYPHRKALVQWQNGARRQIYVRNRQRLCKEYCLAKPLFVGPMLHMKGIIHDVANLQAIRIPEQPSSVADFADLQRLVLNAPNGLQQMLAKKTILLAECLNGLMHSLRRFASISDGQPKSECKRGKSMVAEKVEVKEQIRRKQIVTDGEAKVLDCVQTVAFSFQAALLQLLHTSISQLLARVDGVPGEASKRLFVATLGAHCGEVSLTPQQEIFKDTLSNAFEELLETMDSVPDLQCCRSLVQQIARDEAAAPKISDVLLHDQTWSVCVSRILEAVEMSATEAVNAAQSELSMVCSRAHDFELKWDEAAYVSLTHEFWSVVKDIETTENLLSDIDKCRWQRSVGVIHLDGRALRGELTQIPSNAMATMKQVLITLTHARCECACQQVHCLTRALALAVSDAAGGSAAAIDVLEATCSSAREEGNLLEKQIHELAGMHDALERLHVRLPMDDHIQWSALQRRLSEMFETALPDARLLLERKRRTSTTLTLHASHGEAHLPMASVGQNTSIG